MTSDSRRSLTKSCRFAQTSGRGRSSPSFVSRILGTILRCSNAFRNIVASKSQFQIISSCSVGSGVCRARLDKGESLYRYNCCSSPRPYHRAWSSSLRRSCSQARKSAMFRASGAGVGGACVRVCVSGRKRAGGRVRGWQARAACVSENVGEDGFRWVARSLSESLSLPLFTHLFTHSGM